MTEMWLNDNFPADYRWIVKDQKVFLLITTTLELIPSFMTPGHLRHNHLFRKLEDPK
jgi:hypothetical protein